MDDEALVLTRHKIDIFDYQRMALLGILSEHDRVELIEGEILDMAPIGSEHASTLNFLNRALVLACGDCAIVSVQNSVELDEFNMPQPDFALLRPHAHEYRGRLPRPEDMLALIEVSDSSIRFDRSVKLPIYARSGIPEYWIVDVKRRIVVVHRRPTEDGYGTSTTHEQGERIALEADPEIAIPLHRLFS